MKAEYYSHRGWEDGVVTDETLERLDIDVGPGTGVSGSGGQAPADD
jgi:aldehyde:ferredoxin oxidoreductase